MNLRLSYKVTRSVVAYISITSIPSLCGNFTSYYRFHTHSSLLVLRSTGLYGCVNDIWLLGQTGRLTSEELHPLVRGLHDTGGWSLQPGADLERASSSTTLAWSRSCWSPDRERFVGWTEHVHVDL